MQEHLEVRLVAEAALKGERARARVNSSGGMRIVTVSDAPGKLVWLRRRTCPCCLAVWKRPVRTSGCASHQVASFSSLANLGMGW